jgi:hypothetical protein
MNIVSALKRIWIWVKRRYEIPLNEFSSDPSDTSRLIQEVCARFEGREAIYVEKGVLRVCISNIRGSASQVTISAEVEEILTPGLGVGGFSDLPGHKPRRWRIGAGYLTAFSDQYWATGYGGWSLYFDPKAVEGVLDLAARFPANLDSEGRYSMIVRFLLDRTFLGANMQRVFPKGR